MSERLDMAAGAGLRTVSIALRWFTAANLIAILALLLLSNERLLFTQVDLTWLAMRERGTWRVGLDPSFPPFESLDESGEPVGFDLDLAAAMADEWGLEVEVVPIGFDSLLDALQTGQIDSVVSALPYDPRLTQNVAFSPPYFEAGVRLAVRRTDPLAAVTMDRVDDFGTRLAGRRIAGEWGSISDGVGRRLQRAEASIELAPYATPDAAAAALVADPSIDALLIDNISLRQLQGRGAPIVAVGPALEANPYVIASPRKAHTLRKKIASTLRTLQEAGTLDELETKWFGPRSSAEQ